MAEKINIKGFKILLRFYLPFSSSEKKKICDEYILQPKPKNKIVATNHIVLPQIYVRMSQRDGVTSVSFHVEEMIYQEQVTQKITKFYNFLYKSSKYACLSLSLALKKKNQSKCCPDFCRVNQLMCQTCCPHNACFKRLYFRLTAVKHC